MLTYNANSTMNKTCPVVLRQKRLMTKITPDASIRLLTPKGETTMDQTSGKAKTTTSICDIDLPELKVISLINIQSPA